MKQIRNFLEAESAGSVLLVLGGVLAMALANSPLADTYRGFFAIEVEVRVHQFEVLKPLVLWINDGLMAIFFFLVGLELKREIIDGELSSPSKVVLPALGAIGGMAVPAMVYALFNSGDALAMRGWAIPTATDIAFALGILMILGRAVPTSLKLFLVTLAIIDDIGAIIIIALFYTADLAPLSLAIAGVCLVVCFIMNRSGVDQAFPYLLVGLVMWLSVLKSGVHATLAGVMLAMFIPYRDEHGGSPLKALEAQLHSTVSFVVLPLFALANCGVTVVGLGAEALFHDVPLGVALGLLVGKPAGVLLFCGVAIALGLARLPERSNLLMFCGVACLTGIGFTMSLFIGSLAFEQGMLGAGVDERLGILAGSVASAMLGLMLLKLGIRRRDAPGAAGSAG